LFGPSILALIDSSPVLGARAVVATYALVASAIGNPVAASGEQTLSTTLRRGLKRICGRVSRRSIDRTRPRAAKLARMVAAAGRLRAALAARVAADPDSALGQADALLAAIVAQDVETDPDSGAPRPRQEVAADRIVSTTDPQMRHGRKSKSRRFDGHKMHVVTEARDALGLGCRSPRSSAIWHTAMAILAPRCRPPVPGWWPRSCARLATAASQTRLQALLASIVAKSTGSRTSSPPPPLADDVAIPRSRPTTDTRRIHSSQLGRSARCTRNLATGPTSQRTRDDSRNNQFSAHPPSYWRPGGPITLASDTRSRIAAALRLANRPNVEARRDCVPGHCHNQPA
jgi:hypothetical protein